MVPCLEDVGKVCTSGYSSSQIVRCHVRRWALRLEVPLAHSTLPPHNLHIGLVFVSSSPLKYPKYFQTGEVLPLGVSTSSRTAIC